MMTLARGKSIPKLPRQTPKLFQKKKTKGNESSYWSVWLLLTLLLASSDFLATGWEAVQLKYLLQSLQVLSHDVIRSRLELLLLKENGMFVVVVVSHFDRHEPADRLDRQGEREN